MKKFGQRIFSDVVNMSLDTHFRVNYYAQFKQDGTLVSLARRDLFLKQRTDIFFTFMCSLLSFYCDLPMFMV